MITEDMIRQGLDKKVIKLIDSPNDGEPACQIGEHWFYYAGFEGEGLHTADYLTWTSFDDVIGEILDALSGLEETEKKYYEAVLAESGIKDTITIGVTLEVTKRMYREFEISGESLVKLIENYDLAEAIGDDAFNDFFEDVDGSSDHEMDYTVTDEEGVTIIDWD